MITLYSGTPGSGKSLHASANLLSCVNLHKKRVVTNYDIDISRLKNPNMITIFDNSQLVSPAPLYEISKNHFKDKKIKEGDIVLFLDEAQLLFNSREFGAKNRMAWLSFFSQHRKLGYDVILMAQFDRMLDRQIRSLIEYQVIHRKVSNFGIFGKLLSLLFFGNLFVAVHQWYPLKTDVGSEFFIARKKYYSLYDTFATFDLQKTTCGTAKRGTA